MVNLLMWSCGTRYAFRPDGVPVPHNWTDTPLLTVSQALLLRVQNTRTVIYTANGRIWR